MSDRAYAKAQAQQKMLSVSSLKSGLLQRTYTCRQHTIAGGECLTCGNKQSTLLRSQRAFEPPSAPGAVPGSSRAQEHGPSCNAAFDRVSRFGHDFSRIPVYSSHPPVLQSKLTVNQPGDVYEQEADQVAEQVMRMPEPQLRRACACGGACHKCQTRQPDQEYDRVQAKRVGSGDLEQTAVPAIIHEVLRSPGQPLDTAARAFMEPRFGHDFSGVRVHTDAKAAESARAVSALAYTVGWDVVFGEGRYSPEHSLGRKLLAHELTHVIHQSSAEPTESVAAGIKTTSMGPNPRIQRMKYGSASPPEVEGTKVLVVPREERPLVDEAIRRISAVANDPVGFPKCHQFFAEECQGGKDTLKKTFDAATLWKWPPNVPATGGAMAETPGQNIAYTQSSYKEGVDWLSGALVHELLHNCGGGGDERSPHRRADIARVYCMGAGKSEITAKAAIDTDKNWSLLISYRRLIHEWLSGRLQLNVGADINVIGLLRQIDPREREQTPTELGSGMLGLRKRANIWGAERYGGLLLTADLGFGVDRFKVRAPSPGDRSSVITGAGVILQLGARVEFWVPDLGFKEGRVSALSLEAGYRLVQPLTPEAQQIHEFVFGMGGTF